MTDFLARHWAEFRKKVIDAEAGPQELSDMRWCFMAGAMTVFEWFPRILEVGDDVTHGDLAKFDELQAEIDAFKKEIALTAAPTQGSA